MNVPKIEETVTDLRSLGYYSVLFFIGMALTPERTPHKNSQVSTLIEIRARTRISQLSLLESINISIFFEDSEQSVCRNIMLNILCWFENLTINLRPNWVKTAG